ncbi:hypothetical protein PspLS_01924 [Pyricularia sp. CBS 133598]|nr:hypothetical protein PspLS_01924 [Pyricularia sp. CBS 133598]
MAASNKQGKMINYRMRVTLNDGRQMVGQMMAFDKHMNLVLADTEEFRKIKRKQAKPAAPGASGASSSTVESEEKRTLGLTIVRGAQIVSLSVESPPPADPSARLGKATTGGIASTLTAGPGAARPAARGAAAPISLAGPAAGVGGAPPPGFPGFPGAGAPGFPPPGGYSGVFMRFAFAVTPKNYLLFATHVVNSTAQVTQGYRYFQYHYGGGKEKPAAQEAAVSGMESDDEDIAMNSSPENWQAASKYKRDEADDNVDKTPSRKSLLPPASPRTNVYLDDNDDVGNPVKTEESRMLLQWCLDNTGNDILCDFNRKFYILQFDKAGKKNFDLVIFFTNDTGASEPGGNDKPVVVAVWLGAAAGHDKPGGSPKPDDTVNPGDAPNHNNTGIPVVPKTSISECTPQVKDAVEELEGTVNSLRMENIRLLADVEKLKENARTELELDQQKATTAEAVAKHERMRAAWQSSHAMSGSIDCPSDTI